MGIPHDVAALERVSWLAPLGPEALTRLARASHRVALGRGGLLWRRGERTDALVVVLRGRLDVVRDSADGRRILMRSLGSGQSVGISTLSGLAHSADIVAGVSSELLVIPGRKLREAVRADPSVALGALAQLGETIAQLSDEIEELRFLDLDERLRRILRRCAKGLREIQITHDELGQQVSATRENVSRALKRMERSGEIVCGRGRIEFLKS